MLKINLILTLIFLSITLYAQPGESYESLSQKVTEEKFKVLPYYNLASYFYETEQSSIDSSYYYLSKTIELNATKSNKEEKFLLSKDFSESKITDLQQQIEQKEYKRISKGNNIADYYTFLQRFTPKGEIEKELIRDLTGLQKQEIRKLKSRSELTALHVERVDLLRKYTPENLSYLEYRILKLDALVSGSLSLESFNNEFPNNSFANDAKKEAYFQLIQLSDIEPYESFVRDNPSSPFCFFANDKIANLKYQSVLASKDLEVILDFLTRFPDFEENSTLDLAGAKLIEEKGIVYPVLSVLNDFRVADCPHITEAVFNIYKSLGMSGYLEDFKEKFPTYKVNEVEKELQLVQPYSDLMKKEQTSGIEEYVKSTAPRYTAYLSLIKMFEGKLTNRDWNSVTSAIKEYLPLFGKTNRELSTLLGIVSTPEDFSIRKKSINILNSTVEEYNPVISADGKQLYFCRIVSGRERIFLSTKDGLNWGEPKLVETLAKGGDKAPLALSADGNRLLIFDNGKIRYCDFTGEGWTKPRKFSKNMNTSYWHGGTTISSEDDVLIFAANRDNMVAVPARENLDLFVSFKEGEEWTLPINLGKGINTSFSERTPFLHPNKKTLYFSSDGHGGLGDLDVYKTERLDETWLNWSEPVNLGKMINTPSADWGYVISTEGDLAYFATAAKGSNNQDIFSVNIPKDFQPEKVSTISGNLTDNSGSPIGATILIEDLNSGTTITSTNCNPTTGDFFIVLPEKKLYGYTVEKDGYFPLSGNLDLRSSDTKQQLVKNLKLNKMKDVLDNNMALSIDNLFFETGKSTIEETSFLGLNRLAKLINSTGLICKIEGYTDNVGSDASNLVLSQERADSVKEYLAKQGCSPEKIETAGYGEANSIADNTTAEGRKANRRVTIKLSENK